MRKIIIPFIVLLFSLVGCDKFLDQNPDNRIEELDTPEKIQKLLVSAYPDRSIAVIILMILEPITDVQALLLKK